MLRQFMAQARPQFSDTTGLAAALERAVTIGRESNPGIDLDPERFAQVLAERVEPGPSAAAAVEALRPDALYLCAACLDGRTAAIATFEKRYFPKVVAALRSLDGGQAISDDVQQELRIKLFVGSPPQLASYRGKGDLGRWLSAIAVNAGLRLLKRRAREAPLSDQLAERLMSIGDPSSFVTRKIYAPKVKQALSEALAKQPPQARTELLQYYVEGLTVTELGALYKVAPSTISRRLAKTRDSVLDATRRQLAKELAARRGDLDSIIRGVVSQLELSRSLLEAERHT